MTINATHINKFTGISKRRTASAVFTLFACASVFLLSLFASDKIAHSVKSALSLCSDVIIPSVFPFMVISDFLYAYTNLCSMNTLGYIFEKVFKINRAGLYPFALGILCGFPLGVKCAAELYKKGELTKSEAERIVGFCNNTGPAFLVSGIGLGLRANIKEGFLLYFSMVISSVLTGALFSIGHTLEKTEIRLDKAKRFSFTESIKNAGVNTLNVCSYLTFFACAVGMLRNIIGENYVYLSLISFIEVGSASSIFSKTRLLSKRLSLSLSSFAVGFSGLSVHLQALFFLSDTDVSIKKYFVMKLLQGVFSFGITFIAYTLIF